MVEEAVRAVLERLLLRLQPPAGAGPGGGTLLVALAAEGDAGDGGAARCTVTGAGEALAPLGARDAPPRAVAPCCRRVLDRAPLRAAFELSARRGTLRPGCVALRRFIHGTSVARPELAFHYCFRVDGAASSHAYGPPGAGDVPLCGKIHPVPGAAIALRVPPAAAAAGLGGELSVVPAAALCPCLRQYPNLPARLAAVAISCGTGRGPGGPGGPGRTVARLDRRHVFCFDPAGLPAAPSGSRLLRDPSWLADWGRFGCAAAPAAVPAGEEDVVPPAAAFALQPGAAAGRPQTLLLFLFLRRADPFQGYDAWARRLLASQLEATLRSSREALGRGLRALLHPVLEALGRRAQSQARLARCLPVALQAVTAVAAASSSARFRRRCLRALQAADTPALAAAARRSLDDVTRRRRVPAGSCDAAAVGPPPEAAGEGSGEAAAGQDGPPRPPSPDADDAPPDAGAPRTPGPPTPAEGAAWLREVANLAEWAA
ncbi:type 2 DNA topoisomerase 6 subunit B-like [Dromaius novaehollandiae]|uniref:type 2 DNA topoisomerase 6 subunit B-like n=1 Tax=Dromaius novaehollandiae TaxID=8790 RepID=UPI00311DF44D